MRYGPRLQRALAALPSDNCQPSSLPHSWHHGSFCLEHSEVLGMLGTSTTDGSGPVSDSADGAAEMTDLDVPTFSTHGSVCGAQLPSTWVELCLHDAILRLAFHVLKIRVPDADPYSGMVLCHHHR